MLLHIKSFKLKATYMAYDFKYLKEKVAEVETWLQQEFFGIRTGRATPALLDNIRVEAYGSQMPLNQVASVGVEDARTLRIAPYDATLAKDIERAISQSDLGVSVGADERGVRVSFPELTSERRAQLIKLVKDKLEDARISVKKVREEVWDDIQKKEKAKEMAEDEKFRAKDEMQKIVDEANRRLDEMAERKEKEISS